MENLSELKRMKVGQELKLIYSHYPRHKYLNTTRKIAKMQTNSLMFEGGSWLYFPKAKTFRGTRKGFALIENVMVVGDLDKREEVKFLEYELV